MNIEKTKIVRVYIKLILSEISEWIRDLCEVVQSKEAVKQSMVNKTL